MSDGLECEALPDHVYGYGLLRLLELLGWNATITSRFAGGVVVEVRKPGVGKVVKHGESVAAVAPALFVAAREFDAARRLRVVE